MSVGRFHRNGATCRFLLFFLFLPLVVSAAPDNSFLNDIRVLYLYENPQHIDWPMVYHLALEEGCQVTILTASVGAAFEKNIGNIPEYNLQRLKLTLPQVTWAYLDSAYRSIADWRQPDIIIMSQDFQSEAMQALERYWLSLAYQESEIFQVRKFFKRDFSSQNGTIHVNQAYYVDRFDTVLSEMAARLIGDKYIPDRNALYTAYQLIKTHLPQESGKAGFLTGLDKFRLKNLSQITLGDSYTLGKFNALIERYKEQIDSVNRQSGREQLESMFSAMSTLEEMTRLNPSKPSAGDSTLNAYISERKNLLSPRTLSLTGIEYVGRPFIRRTPEGDRFKLIVDIRNNGPLSILSGSVKVRPYWEAGEIYVDERLIEVLPYKVLTREFPLDLPSDRLETLKPESLLVTGKFRYNDHVFEHTVYAGTKVVSPLTLTLLPDFLAIKPFPELQVDKIVTPISISAVINKPASRAARIRIKVETPPGIMVGAFEENVSLPEGMTSYQFNLPLVATKSLPVGRDYIIVRLFDDDKVLAADTCLAGVVDFQISNKVKIALIPGRDPALEDFLTMAQVEYKVLSDRFLQTRDINYYDVLVIGSGAFTAYPSLARMDHKLKKFMERGGTILVFGQDENWPVEEFPVSIDGARKGIKAAEIEIKSPQHPLFAQTHKLDLTRLKSDVDAEFPSFPAVVFPGKEIISSTTGGILLAEALFEKGRLLYCGLPLSDMMRHIDREAFRFLANLINYSGK